MDQSASLCRICGDQSRGYNYGIISCMPCKAFFRRNALRSPDSLFCTNNNSCSINKNNRSQCSSCRLRKCLMFGMRRELIRAFDSIETNLDWQHRLPLPQPIDLLRQDRSLMTMNEWTLLSNLIHLYDRQSICERISVSIIQEQATLPLKLRAKSTSLITLILESENCVENLIKDVQEFQSLSIIARRCLLRNNFMQAVALNTVIIDKCLEVSANDDFDLALESLFGPGGLDELIVVRQRMDANILLPKILLFIMLFSSNFSIVRYDRVDDLQSASHTLQLVRIQDKYVTMLWKYMVYKFGYSEAVLRYASIVWNMMDVFLLLKFAATRSIFDLVVAFITSKLDEIALTNR